MVTNTKLLSHIIHYYSSNDSLIPCLYPQTKCHFCKLSHNSEMSVANGLDHGLDLDLFKLLHALCSHNALPSQNNDIMIMHLKIDTAMCFIHSTHSCKVEAHGITNANGCVSVHVNFSFQLSTTVFSNNLWVASNTCDTSIIYGC